MDNLVSIITFLPLVAALILAFFLKGDDAAAHGPPLGAWERYVQAVLLSNEFMFVD